MNIRKTGKRIWTHLAAPFYIRSWDEVSDSALKTIPIEDGVTLSPVQIRALGERVKHLPSQLLQYWTQGQLDALSGGQIRSLRPEQLQCMVSNGLFGIEQMKQLLSALAKEEQHYKFGEVLQAIEYSPWKHRAIDGFVKVVKELPSEDARKYLTVAAKVATAEQFTQILHHVGMEDILTYFHHDQNDVLQSELAAEVEEEEFTVNADLQKLEYESTRIRTFREGTALNLVVHLLDKLEEAGTVVEEEWNATGKSLTAMLHNLEAITSPPKEVTEKLRESIMTASGDPESAVTQWNTTFDGWLEEMEEKKECLHQKLLTPQHLIDHWLEELLPQKYGNLEDRMPSTEELEHLFTTLRKDANFLEKQTPSLHSRIQLESGCGKFSVSFFNRVIAQKMFEPTDDFLEMDEIEEILGLPGMMEVLDLFTLNHRVETITQHVAERVAERHAA